MELLIQCIFLFQLLIIAFSMEVKPGDGTIFPSLANIYTNRRLQSLCLGMIMIIKYCIVTPINYKAIDGQLYEISCQPGRRGRLF